MLKLLNIPALRIGADPGNPEAPNAANYDELRANPYSLLPNPLLLKDGQTVTSAAAWWKLRRPEILQDFEKEVWGRVPQKVPRVTWAIVSTTADSEKGIPVNIKNLVGHVDNSGYPAIAVDIKASLVIPARVSGPFPVFLAIGRARSTYDDSSYRGTKPNTIVATATWQSQVLSKGWGYAYLTASTVQRDRAEDLVDGIIGLTNSGKPRAPDDWGVFRAWAWGASQVLDYLSTEPSVDARQVGVWGDAGFGSAALIAMATDERFAIGFIDYTGLGGAKLYRRDYGERIENLAGASEYYRVAGAFLKYAGPLTANDLPVDTHELIALCAPRPLFISVASDSLWSDPMGVYLAAKAAGTVYRLLGRPGLEGDFKETGASLEAGDIAFLSDAKDNCAGLVTQREYLKSHPGTVLSVVQCQHGFKPFLDFAARYIHSEAAVECGFRCMGAVDAPK